MFKGELIFVRILVPFLCGSVAVICLPYADGVYTFCRPLLLLLALSLFFVLKKYLKYRIYFKRWIPGLLISLFVFVFAYVSTAEKRGVFSKDHFSKTIPDGLVVTVLSEPGRSGKLFRFEAEVNQVLQKGRFSAANGKILVSVNADTCNTFRNPVYGDRMLIPASYTPPDPPFNPWEFNYKQYLANHNFFYQAFTDCSEVEYLSAGQGNGIVAFAQRQRKKMVGAFQRYIRDPEAAAVASTLILGYRADLSKELLSAYSKTGVMHVLSVSGMHVALVLFILNKLLWFAERNKAFRVFKALFVILLIWYYSLLTGFSSSVCRAALMITILIAGNCLGRKINPYNLLAASMVLLLLCDPFFILDTGFQLSYLAVFGLVFFYPLIYQLWYVKNRLIDKIWGSIAVSAAAQLATLPLSLYYFHQFPVWFLFSNLFILLPVMLIMYAGLAFLLIYTSGAIFHIPTDGVLKLNGGLLDYSISFMDHGLVFMENLPYAVMGSYHHGFYYVLIGLLIIAFTFALLYADKKLVYVALALLFILVSWNTADILSLRRGKRVIFYSLKKNTAICFFNGYTAAVYTDADVHDKLLDYSVKPSLAAMDVPVKFVENEYFDEASLLRQGCFFKFGNWTLFTWTNKMDGKRFSKRLKVNAVLLAHNPKISLAELNQSVEAGRILIDSTNPERMVKQWLSEAGVMRLKCYLLKKKPALIVCIRE